MQSVFSTKDNSGECSDFEVEVDKNNIMWSKVRCQNNTPEDSSWIEISLISGDEQDDKDDQQQPSVEHDTKKPSNDVDRYTTMNGGQTLDSNRKGEGENLVDGHSDTMTNSDKCNVIEYGTWLASASLKSVVDGDDLSAADNSSKVEVPKTVATARPREVKSKPLLKSRRKTPVVNLGSLNGSHGTNSQEVPQLKRRQIKHVNLEEHFVVSGFKLSKRDNSSTRVTKGRMTANLKSSLSSQHLDQVTETIPSSRLQPDDAAAAADKIKPESPATANNGYVPNLSGDGEGEQQEIKQVDVQKKRRVVRRKSRNAWQKGKLRTKGRLILKRRNKCASNPPLKQTCVTEITTVVSEPCGDDDSVTPTLEALRVSVTDTRSVTADCKAIDLRSNEVSVMDTVDESALDTLVSSKEDSHSHPDSEVVKSGPGRNRRLKRDLKCFVEYIAKNGLVSRRTSRTCNKTIKAEPVKLWQKNKVEASLRSKQKNNLELHRNTKSPSKTSPSCTTGSSSSTTSHMQLVNPSKLKRKLEEKNEAPVKNVKRRQTVDVVTISNSPKLEKKIQKVQQKGQNGSNDKVKGTVKKTLVSKAQLQNVVKKSKKVPGKIQRRISGSEVAVKQKSVKTKGTVHSLVSQKKKAIRMQLALEKKKKNETKQKKVLASKENNDHAVELVSVKRVYRNSTTAKGVRSSAPIARSCTVALHSLKSAGYTIEGTKKYHLSSELDLRDNSPKALCVSPGHLQLHRLAAIFPSVRPLSLDGQKQSLSCTHPLPQPKRTSKNGSQLQRKSRLSKKGVILSRPPRKND